MKLKGIIRYEEIVRGEEPISNDDIFEKGKYEVPVLDNQNWNKIIGVAKVIVNDKGIRYKLKIVGDVKIEYTNNNISFTAVLKKGKYQLVDISFMEDWMREERREAINENILNRKQKQEDKKTNGHPDFEYDEIKIRNGEEVK